MIERHWDADLIAKIFGIIFILVGLLGFTNNPLVSETGLFRVNDAHNWAHLLSGALFLGGAYMGAPVMTIRWLAVIYVVIAVLGFFLPGNNLFGFIEMNMADHWLHAFVAGVLLAVGFLTPVEQRLGSARL